jgi:hypothetical protein
MKSREARLTLLRRDDRARKLTAARIGTIVSVDDSGGVEVSFTGSKQARAARLAVEASIAQLKAAVERKQEVVLLCEGGDPARPLIVGFVQLPARDGGRIVEADVDGKRVRVTGKDEIVLQCGSASVTLRRNGRVVIRGTHIETYSDGTNRIKGGQVRIN